MATAPQITTQPISQTVSAGSAVTLSVTASGTAPLLYQWKKEGADINGANGTSFTVPSVQLINTGTYAVEVYNNYGFVVSNTAVIAITSQDISEGISTGLFSSTIRNFLTTADCKGRFQFSYGENFSSHYTWPSTYFTDDCKATAYFKNFNLVFNNEVCVLAGGTTSAKILVIDPNELSSNYSVNWTVVSNSIGQPIRELYAADVYLNWTFNGSSYTATGNRSYVLLAGCSGGRIAYSTNGTSWTVPSSQPFVTALNDDPVIGFTHYNIGIFAASQKGKVAYSSNGGVTWSLLTTGLPSNVELTFITNIEYVLQQPRIIIGGENNFLAQILV